MKYLGESFDIHCGGVDLIFPHHENEIAQSEGATGKPFVKHWFHVEFLLVEGEKMSKSKGNFYTVRDLIDKGSSADAIRYLLLSVPYSTQLNFTLDGLKGAESAIEKLRNFRHRVKTYEAKEGATERVQQIVERAREEFTTAMNDDLNTSGGLAALFDLRRDVNIAIDASEFGSDDKKAVLNLLENLDSVLGILGEEQDTSLDAEIEALIHERNEARKNRDYARADEIRKSLAERDIILEDTPQGTKWKKK
jgi:cysteinyl-tRNA synthetase